MYVSFMLLLMLGFTAAWAQQITVTGQVLSADDEMPIPGVSVSVVGTTIGTVTDVDGNYSINVRSGEDVLRFSFVGMTRQDIVVGDQRVIDVTLEPGLVGLDEIVVVGYGTRLRSELTGSIASVRASDIAGSTQPSFESAIQGRAAGVLITGGSGKVGQSVKMRVRGVSSLSASGQPLYVIDGFPVTHENLGRPGNEALNPLADLNPADIESIEVLKDASASAIFGARAANGVVLVTTKRGRDDVTRFNFNVQSGFSDPARKVGFLDRDQYIDLVAEGFENRLALGYPTGPWGSTSYEQLLGWIYPYWDHESQPNTNWEDQALRRAGQQQYDLSVSGGTEATRIYSSLSWNDQESILVGNSFDRASGRINVDHRASDRVNLGVNLGLTRTRHFRVANDNAFATPLQMVALSPLDPTHIPDTDPPELNPSTLYDSGLFPLEYSNEDTEIFRNIGNLFANYYILPELTLRSDLGIDILNHRDKMYYGRLTADGGPDGLGYDRTVTRKNITSNTYLTYENLLGDFDVSLVGGTSFQYADTDFASITGRGFPNDNFRRLASASDITSASSSGTEFSFLSYFLRSNLIYRERYIASLSGRIDGSSRFGADNRYGLFPAASGAWIISREDFMAGMDAISFLKLRASWGLTGNAEIGDFSSRGLYSGSNYAGLPGMVPTSIPSPDLKWETTSQFDIGLDFGFLDNRITGEIDYYLKNTEDMLLDVQVPATTGFTTVTSNVGRMENKGWEFVLNTANLTGDFSWNTDFNIAFNRNKVTDLDGQIIGVRWRAMEGQPLGVFWMPKFAGVDPDNGDALFYVDDTRTETTNNIAAAADQIVGDPNPDFIGGITNTFRFRGFDLSVLAQFVYGNDLRNGGHQWQAESFATLDNKVKYVYENRWQNPGDITDVPQIRLGLSNGYGISSMQVFDGSYLRFKDVTLGYTLPGELVQRANISSARIFVKALNLYTITDYPGWDPEANFTGTGPGAQTMNLTQGYDFYTAPQPRTITFGVNLEF